MPRRARTAAPAATTVPAAEPTRPRVPERAPRPAKLKSLLALNRTAKENMNEIKDSLGGTMSDATENHGLHKKAFGWVKQLDGMSPEKINDLLTHFAYYIDVTGIEARGNSAQPHPALVEGEREEDETPLARGTVVGFPAQAQQG